MFMRNRKFLTINLIISKQQYIDIDRTVSIKSFTVIAVQRFHLSSETFLYALAYLQDHQSLGFRIISFLHIKFIQHCGIYEPAIGVKAPWLSLQKVRNRLVGSPQLNVQKTYRILDILPSVSLI